MRTQFHNREEAGQLLASKLTNYADRPDLLVLGLPRGGVPVAHEVALRLNAPLDVFVVRKLGLPGQKELAMGAIASGGIRVLNRGLVDSLQIPDRVIDAVTELEQTELERRERAYRGGRPAPEVRGRTVILVDDGIATGSTMYAAISAVRDRGASRVVVATPIISTDMFMEMRREVDDMVAVTIADESYGVGEWYEDFSQTTDEDVRRLLGIARQVSNTAPV